MQQHPSQIFRRLSQPWCAICNARHFICRFRCRLLSSAFQNRKRLKQRVLKLASFSLQVTFQLALWPNWQTWVPFHQSWRQTAQTHSSDATVAGEQQTRSKHTPTVRRSPLLKVACSGLEGPPIFGTALWSRCKFALWADCRKCLCERQRQQ